MALVVYFYVRINALPRNDIKKFNFIENGDMHVALYQWSSWYLLRFSLNYDLSSPLQCFQVLL